MAAWVVLVATLSVGERGARGCNGVNASAAQCIDCLRAHETPPASLSWNMYRAQPAEGLAYSMAAYGVNDSVSAMIRKSGVWEPVLTRVVAQHIRRINDSPRKWWQRRRRATLLDIGGNIGWFTSLGASLGARVHTFEPNANNRWLIEQTLCTNKHLMSGKVTIYPFGAGAMSKSCAMISPEKNVGDTMVVCGDTERQLQQWNAWGAPRGFRYAVRGKLDITRVDERVKEPVDVVKIDIEGYEPEALLGLKGVFERRPLPELIVSEFQPAVMAANGFDAHNYLRFFLSRGYDISAVQSAGMKRVREGHPGGRLRSVGRTTRQVMAWLNASRSWYKSHDLVMQRSATSSRV